MSVAEESLANLEKRKPWTSETAPRGRKNAGLSVNEWRNQMVSWKRSEWIQIIEDEDSPGDKVIAAQELLKAAGGNLEAARQVCDYTNGKPIPSGEIQQSTTIRVIIVDTDARDRNTDTDFIAETPRLAIESDARS